MMKEGLKNLTRTENIGRRIEMWRPPNDISGKNHGVLIKQKRYDVVEINDHTALEVTGYIKEEK